MSEMRNAKALGVRNVVLPPRVVCEATRAMLSAAARSDQRTYATAAEALGRLGWRLGRIDDTQGDEDTTP